jgi:hypothetical protein
LISCIISYHVSEFGITWLIKNGLPYDYADLLKNENEEVAILGGGVLVALAG